MPLLNVVGGQPRARGHTVGVNHKIAPARTAAPGQIKTQTGDRAVIAIGVNHRLEQGKFGSD